MEEYLVSWNHEGDERIVHTVVCGDDSYTATKKFMNEHPDSIIITVSKLSSWFESFYD